MKNKTSLCLLAGSAWALIASACNDAAAPSFGDGGASGSGSGAGATAGTSATGGVSSGSSSSSGTGSASTGQGGSQSSSGGSHADGEGGEPGHESGGSAGASEGSGGDGGDAPVGGAGGENDGGGDDGPILAYHFEEGSGSVVADSSTRGLDATLSDENAWSTQGRSGNALSLAGGTPASQYVSVPSGILTGVSEATLAAWIRLDTNPIWHRLFDFGNQGAGTDTRFMYLTPNGPEGIRFSVFGGAPENEATVTTGTVLPTGVWKHVAATVAANGEHAIYVDGFPAAKVMSVIVPPSEMEPVSPLGWLGKSRFPDAGLDGLMDDFVIYDRVLSASEIADLAWPKGDYSRLRFDEAAGDGSIDSSDRGIDATLEGGAAWSTGRLGAGIALEGTDEYIALDSDPLGGCTTELTLALWVKLGAATQWARLLDFGNAENFLFLTPRDAANALRFVMYTPDAETAVASATTVPVDGGWHHVGVVVSPVAVTLYLDGSQVGNLPDPVVTPGDLGVLTENFIGKSRFAPDPYLSAVVDELRISCRAFTADEVKNLAFQ